MGRTALLTSKRCILYIYSTNIGTEYFKHALYSPFFSLQNAVCFIMLNCLVPVLFTFYKQGVLKLKKNNSGAKGLRSSSGCLRLLTHLPVTSIIPSILSFVTCCSGQFLRKIWPLQIFCLPFFFICYMFRFSFSLSNSSPFFAWSIHVTSIQLQNHISKLSMSL